MNARMLIAALFLLVSLPGGLAAQGYAGLGAGAQGYEAVTPDRTLAFPVDHGPHPGFRIEWWYLTANLTGPDGAPMGLQWTLFRQAAQPGDTGEGWDSAQIWMGHAAVTDAATHRVAETFARGGIGQAGVRAAPFEAFIDDWRMAGDTLEHLSLSASGTDFSYALEMVAQGPLVLHGQAGFSVKSDQGQASYYYSQPFFEVTGTVTADGIATPVTGRAWLDREWSSQPLAPDQDGWDWFSLHFDDGAKLMAFRLRGDTDYTSGTWIAADGAATPLGRDAVRLTPLAHAAVAGRTVPVRWRVEVPDRKLDVTVAALNDNSFMTTVFPYWEGPVSVAGSHGGVGYLEMTGYDR